MPTLESARQWYPSDDPVHGFDHVERVFHLGERLAIAEKADLEIIQAAALLHDAQGSAPDGSERPNHHLLSAEFAGTILSAEGWTHERISAVQHCIRAHRFRRNGEEPATIEAKVLFDADKLDVLGAIGSARTLGYALKAHTPFFSEPSVQFLKSGQEMPGELHSAYHEYLFKLNKISALLYTKTGRDLAAHRQRFLNEFFDELAAEFRGQR
jgi:uncharacterized protein